MCVTVKQIISCGFGREHQHIQHKPCALMMSVRWTMLKNWPRTTLEQRDAPHWMKSINNFSWWIVVPNSWNTTGSVRTLLFFFKIAGSACTLLYFIWLWMTTLWNPQRRETKVSSNLGKNTVDFKLSTILHITHVGQGQNYIFKYMRHAT